MALANNIKSGFEKVAEKIKGLAPVAFSGSYNDLTDKPSIADDSTVMHVNQANVLTGSNMFLARRDTSDSAIMLHGGTGVGTGACLSLIGNDISDIQAGEWELSCRASTSAPSYNFRGTKDGQLIFGGQNLPRKINGLYPDTAGNLNITLADVEESEDYVTYFNNKLA